MKRAWGAVRGFLGAMDQAHREKVVALTNYEARELENMFVVLLLGSFTGLPSPPSFLAVELLPYLEHEVKVLNRRAQDTTDSLAEIMGVLDADG